MSHVAIRAEGLGKRYRIGAADEQHETFGAAVGSWLKTPVKNFRRLRRLSTFGDIDEADVVWALRDVAFEVKDGEVVGFIGHNGAGKSTLLKILSRITEPTTGHAEIRGRVSSLLEVGTGFNPELTGRENVFLNGTILGMTKGEVARKFDEIVAFSGVERFIDTPVKRYSSGMKVRLGFAVAAHLEPDVLIVDEVLAVGDFAFKKKCLGKMDEVSQSGRTVLYVSHELGTVTELCQRAYVLARGRVVHEGPAEEAVEWYLRDMAAPTDSLRLGELDKTQRGGNGRVRFTAAYLEDKHGQRTITPVAGEPVDVVMEFEAREPLREVMFSLLIRNHFGTAVAMCHMRSREEVYEVPAGAGRVRCRIPRLPLPHGAYQVMFRAQDAVRKTLLDQLRVGLEFDVGASRFYPTAYTPEARFSAALLDYEWRQEGVGVGPLLSTAADGGLGASPPAPRAAP